jgi:hypothetical protein
MSDIGFEIEIIFRVSFDPTDKRIRITAIKILEVYLLHSISSE